MDQSADLTMWLGFLILIGASLLWLNAKMADAVVASKMIDAANRLPGAEQADAVYDLYHPLGVGLSTGRIPQWRTEFRPSTGRRNERIGRIDIAEISAFRSMRGGDLRARGAARLRQIDGQLRDFPAQRPFFTREPKPPEKPRLSTFDDLSAVGPSNRLSWRDEWRIRTIIAVRNRGVVDAYDRAMGRYREVQNEGLEQLKTMVADWEKGRAAWQGARDREIDYIHALIALISRVDEPERAAREIVRRLPLPAWTPMVFELRFDPLKKLLIIEHEAPNIDDVTWVEAIGVGADSIVGEPPEPALQAACACFYPALSFFVARSVVAQLAVGSVDTIAVNGWCRPGRQGADAAKRVYCSSLLVSVPDLRRADRGFADSVAAFDALGGVASRTRSLNAVSPSVRLNPADPRYIHWSEGEKSPVSVLAR